MIESEGAGYGDGVPGEEAEPLAGRLGAVTRADGTVELTVWAPRACSLEVHAAEAAVALERDDEGVYRGAFPGGAGDQYLLVVDAAATCPDPCSRFQPHGVRGPSEAVDHSAFEWTDAAWEGVALDDLVIYELHIGAF